MQCVVDNNGYIISSDTVCDYVLLTESVASQLIEDSQVSLTIDAEVYGVVTGYLLLSFLAGHILGRIVKTMGRS